MKSLDARALILITGLSVVIAVLIGGSQVCGQDCFFRLGPRVQEFSWNKRSIGSEDRAFILSFNRPMDRQSVEANLQLQPPLEGKYSWAGRRMAYTLNRPAPYGLSYTVRLDGARERYGSEKLGQVMEPFIGHFQTRDRAFAYIGSEGEERGRLVLYNLTQQEKTVLTPPDTIVTEFEPYPQGDRLLYLATDRESRRQGQLEGKLYEVSTGLDRQTPPGEIELLLDSQNYQILQFDLSPDGTTLVVRRVNRDNPDDFRLWTIREGGKPQPIEDSNGGDFAIAPDGQTLAIARGQGVALVPLTSQGKSGIDFLPKYGQVLSFSHDGTTAATIDFNQQDPQQRFLKSLILVDNRGRQEKLLDTDGSIVSCEFGPRDSWLFCLLTRLLEDGEVFVEQPYIVAIDTETARVKPLIALPNYLDVHFSLAPDGIGLLFDQIIPAAASSDPGVMSSDDGEAIATARLWLLVPPASLDFDPAGLELEELPLPGLHPRWLP